MVRFLIALFVVYTTAVVAQPDQPQIQPVQPQILPAPDSPSRGGPWGFGFGGFPRPSGSPLILGPGPVIGGSGFGDNSPFGSSESGESRIRFRPPGSVIGNRNNFPNTNGFPPIAGPGPVINPNRGPTTTPFPPITEGIRQKRAAGVSSTPAPSQDPLRNGQGLPLNQDTGIGNQNIPSGPQQPGFPGSNTNQFPNSFGFPGQQNNGFPGQQNGGFPGQNNGFGNNQFGFGGQNNGFGIPAFGSSTPGPFGGFPQGSNQNGFNFGNGGFFPNNGPQQPGFGGIGQPGSQSGGFVDQQGFRQTGPFIDQAGLGNNNNGQPISQPIQPVPSKK